MKKHFLIPLGIILVPLLAYINMPTDFNIPDAALAQIKQKIDVGIQKGEAMKKQMQQQQPIQ